MTAHAATPFAIESPFVRRARRQAPRVRLICFPYAGAGASVYADWPRGLPPEIEVLAVQLPGRQDRRHEPAFTRMRPLIETLAQVLRPYVASVPFALFGHSGGAMVGFELARTLRRRLGAEPAWLFLSGHAAPDLPRRAAPIHTLPPGEFTAQLRDLDGTPPEVLGDDHLMELLEPTLRADFTLLETHRFAPGEPLSCPVTGYAGESDREAGPADVAAWAAHTTGEFTLRTFPGGHFFLTDAREAILEDIAGNLLPR
ncbi:thioesterase II family protein [Paractinoplanes atraurantiacus]|uniref:Medium-chain acyl-[acyl-carrier-protein] hydrolase n=1 Tax=Paractinoplanes atraurantiacus TaxID=1036182 RepID=A0A285GLQ0_9ACTN|nr:alpha/beta fold hydrolase [Actinoplanes atraurantiacus]SNY24497.1 medium-chain acyl-[acyl-carrier-protein] hydrolase [Actinoplanes atraurantiacus]